jgi:metaxin
MELFSWSPDFGLPSWHQRCLAMQAYCKFSGAPVTVRPSDNPFWTPEGDLPVFRHGTLEVVGFEALVRHLHDCKFSADFRLNAKQRAESQAFSTMLDEQLAPALALSFWLDARNHLEVTRPWFASRLPFPLAFVYPARYHERALALVDFDDYAVTERHVLDVAEECIRSISLRLGDAAYMHGNAPSSLDALVFSYLAPMLKVKMPDSQLAAKVEKYPNLAHFVGRVLSTYFPGISQKEHKAKDPPVANESSSDKSLPNSVAAFVVAAIAMTAYAFTSGLVKAVKGAQSRRAGHDDE